MNQAQLNHIDKNYQLHIYLFAVMDKKAGLYQNFFTEKTQAQAIRSFSAGVNTTTTQLYQYPDDFELVQLGKINEITGQLIEENVCLGLARTYLNSSKPSNATIIPDISSVI